MEMQTQSMESHAIVRKHTHYKIDLLLFMQKTCFQYVQRE